MKKLMIAAFMVFFSFSSECTTIAINPLSFIISKLMCNSTIQGSGIPKTQHLPLSNITRVSFNVSGNLFINQCKDPNNCVEQLITTADDNFFDILQASINGNSLELSQKPNSSISVKTPIKYHLTLKNISNITQEGSGDITSSPIATDTLNVQTSGSGRVKLQDITAKKLKIVGLGHLNVNAHINIDELTIESLGHSNITLTGSTKKQNVNLSGLQNYNAKNLESFCTLLNISGTGEIHINARDKIEGTMTGATSGTYNDKHRPEVNVRTYGASRFKKS